MPRRQHELRLSPTVAQWVVQALTRLLATFAIIQGAFIIMGGPERWRAPSFAAAMTVPGAPASWGWALAALGALTLAGTFTAHMRVTAVSAIGIGAWCLFFAISFTITALRDPSAATTGVWAYGTFAVAGSTLGVAYYQSR